MRNLNPRECHLLVSSLRQRAVLEANTRYGGKVEGIARELTALADSLDVHGAKVHFLPLSDAAPDPLLE